MAIISSTFKVRSAVIASTFKVGGTVSSTFKIAPAVVESTFGIRPVVVSSTFGIRTGVVSSTFKIIATPRVDNVTYVTSSDCTKLIVTLDRTGFSTENINSVFVGQVGIDGLMDVSVADVDGKVIFTIPITADGVYTLTVFDNNNQAVVRIPLLVTCRLHKCFIEVNNKEMKKLDKPTSYSARHQVVLDQKSTDWLMLAVTYRSIMANFKVSEFDMVAKLLERIKPLCNCNCDTCSIT